MTPPITKPVFANYMEMQTRIPNAVWHLLRAMSVASATGVCALLFVDPKLGLWLFWGIVVPMLPLLFFITPGLWRNLCPAATLNQVPCLLGFSRGLNLPNWLSQCSSFIGIGALFLLIPTRKVLFNHDGSATALLLIGVLSVAFIGGTLFKGKSGWCSSVCPLLPVQRLYGQTPFVIVRNSHCNACVGCARNCNDFNPTSAYLAAQYDEDRHYSGPSRFFAGAFPALVLAFYTVPDPPAIPVLDMYFKFGLYVLVGAGSFFALDTFLRVTPNKLPALYGATALNLFAWFNVSPLVARWGGLIGIRPPIGVAWTIQFALLALTLVWLIRTYRREALFVAERLAFVPTRVGTIKASAVHRESPEGCPVITFMPGERRATAELGRTLLECVEAQGYGIEAGCRMGVCGADPVAILAGMENLSAIGREERSTLERLGLDANTRMACRARIHGSVSVSLTPQRRESTAPATVIDFQYDRAVKSVVILGAGIAGVTAADHIRRRNPSCEIHLIGREKHYLYNRMGISRLIYGRSAMQGLYLLPESWYEEHRITCWINTQALSIDRASRQIHLATGENLHYDRLVLAMGSSSYVPPIEGFGLAGTFVLRDADDAMKIRAFAQENECRHAVIAGGGLLGLEAGYALHKLGIKVSVIERSKKLLSRQLDRRGSHVLREYLERMMIETILSAETDAVLGEGQFVDLLLEKPGLKEFFGDRARGRGRVRQALLSDGRIIPCDLFLAAVGIKPNVVLAAESGLRINRGVIVDASMRTDDPSVFAVGDVAEFQQQVSGLWPAAVEQAEIAAINCVGGDATYHGAVPVTMLKVAGIDLMSVGRVEPQSTEEMVIDLEDIVEGSEERHYRKLVIADDRIIGAVLIGYPIDAPFVTAAIQQNVVVSPILDRLRSGDWQSLNGLVQA